MKHLLLAFLLMLPMAVHASGSEGLALQVMCETYTQLSGTMGLMIGLGLAVWGLYIIIRKAAYTVGIVMILGGALLTALPGLIFSTLGGVGNVLRQSGITTSDVDISVVLGNVASYKGRCSEIVVDLQAYNDWASGGGIVDVGGAMGARGQGVQGPQDYSNMPTGDSPWAGQQLPCVGKVLDLNQDPNAKPSARGFGMRPHPLYDNQMKMHNGQDIPSRTGTRILAMAAGTVRVANWVSGYGNYVCITHSAGMETCYAHMTHDNVFAGQGVSAGDVIGFVGSTGGSTGPHLHFEVKSNGKFVEPMQYLGCGGGNSGGR